MSGQGSKDPSLWLEQEGAKGGAAREESVRSPAAALPPTMGQNGPDLSLALGMKWALENSIRRYRRLQLQRQ